MDVSKVGEVEDTKTGRGCSSQERKKSDTWLEKNLSLNFSLDMSQKQEDAKWYFQVDQGKIYSLKVRVHLQSEGSFA